MQFDMHYFGTFAMAYAAGLQTSHAHTLATSAQLVDDNNFNALHELDSGQAVMGVATAHHPLDAGTRVVGIGNPDDSRMIWVPFHFLPGNEGKTFEEKVICRKNSAVAQTMMAYYTKQQTVDAHRDHCLQLMGIAGHVYADTFSHYGFSGISSKLNEVDATTINLDKRHSKGMLDYLKSKALDFGETFSAAFAGTVQLGHGAVATYPDRPFLRWSYTAPDGNRLVRDNPSTFLEACQALHESFSRFRAAFYASGNGGKVVPFSQIEAVVKEILAIEADANGRISVWKKALKDGRIGDALPVPDYSPTQWIDDLKSVKELVFNTNLKRVDSPAYGFFTAADYHRNYVLKRLLPEVGLFVA